MGIANNQDGEEVTMEEPHEIEQDMEHDEHELEGSRNQAAARSLSGQLGSLVRWVSDSLGGKNYEDDLLKNLRRSTMFRYCSERSRLALANSMELETFKRGDILMIQGEPQTSAIILVEGKVARLRLVDEQLHHMATMGSTGSGATVGMLHLLREEKAFSTVRAMTDGVAYRIQSDVFRELLEESPEFAQEVIFSLTREVRKHTKLKRTPLFLQSGKALPAEPLPWFAVSCAAAVESFYRSGLNAFLNAQLSGQPRGKLFPDMHIQLPTRVLYINGFKGIRHVIDSRFAVSEYENPELVGLGLAVVPGIAMTPISSVLEACNAGNMNPESLSIRWTRGIIPRCAREVIFGIGINQLSDFCEERMDGFFSNQKMKNLGGSLVAGLISGYFSHIPHNLSTLKLLMPQKTYRQHFNDLCTPWGKWFDREIGPLPKKDADGFTLRSIARRVVVPTLTCALPKGSLIRTAQIAGSFVLINTTVNALSHINVNVSISRTASTT